MKEKVKQRKGRKVKRGLEEIVKKSNEVGERKRREGRTREKKVERRMKTRI